MNKNSKEKSARIEIRTTPPIKKKIERYAKKCGLSLSEYVTKKALGYAPRESPSDFLIGWYGRLCNFCNGLSGKLEDELLTLIDELHKEIFLKEEFR